MLPKSRLVLEDLLRLELCARLRRKVKLLDEVEVARPDASPGRTVDVALGFVDTGGVGGRGCERRGCQLVLIC